MYGRVGSMDGGLVVWFVRGGFPLGNWDGSECWNKFNIKVKVLFGIRQEVGIFTQDSNTLGTFLNTVISKGWCVNVCLENLDGWRVNMEVRIFGVRVWVCIVVMVCEQVTVFTVIFVCIVVWIWMVARTYQGFRVGIVVRNVIGVID